MMKRQSSIKSVRYEYNQQVVMFSNLFYLSKAAPSRVFIVNKYNFLRNLRSLDTLPINNRYYYQNVSKIAEDVFSGKLAAIAPVKAHGQIPVGHLNRV